MKKLFIFLSALLMGFHLIARDPGDIEEKLIKSFNASFPSAEQVHWFEMPKTWVVNFISQGIRSRIVYQKDGKLTEFTRYYQEAGLPFLIQSKIKKVYPNKKIFGVIEVSKIAENGAASNITYFVKLEDDKNWTTVKADNEANLEVVEKYRKAL
jgi:hypothetical protein